MKPVKLLVLDDDETVGRLLVMAAQSAGYEAQWCERPQPFFDATRHWAPTHLAVDLQMPEMNGLEVIRRLGASGCTAGLIVTSGAGRAETDAALLEAARLGLRTVGALDKPFSIKRLRSLLTGADPSAPAPAGSG